jgi:hypothetical protein
MIGKAIETKLETVLGTPSRFEKSSKEDQISAMNFSKFRNMDETELRQNFCTTNKPEFIISFTSFGERLKYIDKCVYSIFSMKRNDIQMVLTLYKEDEANITPFIRRLSKSGLLKILTSDVDYGPHLKYIRAMEEFYGYPIITIDDDRTYTRLAIERLVEKYRETKYKSVIANIALRIQHYDDKIFPMKTWCKHRLRAGERSFTAMAEGFGGVLYPPKCFADLQSLKQRSLECKYDDDLFLRIEEGRQDIPVTNTDRKKGEDYDFQVKESLPWNLHCNLNSLDNADGNRNTMVKKYEKELLALFRLR